MKPGDMDVTGQGHYTLDENHRPAGPPTTRLRFE